MRCFIVDAHQHFWDPRHFEYFWMTPKVERLVRPFLPEHLAPILKSAGVQQTVLVQAISSLAEAHWLLELSCASDFVGGVVAWADLTAPELGAQLDELQRHPRFKGVRHMIESEPEEAWPVRSDVLDGLAELERREIPFDLLVRPRHLKYVPRIRDRCPRLKLVIDHIAKPPIAEGKIEEWLREIENVSRLSDVWCKLSGMVTEARVGRWTAEDLKPYVSEIVRLFGSERVMFGSDWPVCTLAATYQQVIEALKTSLGPLSEADARSIWGETAKRFYRLT